MNTLDVFPALQGAPLANEGMPDREGLLTLCHDLAQAGIWLYLNKKGELVAGPPRLVKQSSTLLERLRMHKPAVLRLLQESLAVEMFGEAHTDARFAQERCPLCERQCYVIYPPRRLEAHRMADGITVCPGSEQAQAACAETIMTAFLADRCIIRPMQVLTWHGLRGALQAWCQRRGWLLPPRLYIVGWMDAHFTAMGGDTMSDVPRWAGLTLTIEEWLGDDDVSPKEVVSQGRQLIA